MMRQLWGTPTVETDSAEAMIYKVLDADADFDTLLFTITVTPPDLKPTFGDAMITDLFAEVDQSVAWPLPEATGGDGVLRYSLSNQPDGLVLSADARQVRGAATATDTTVATYTVTDADGDTATLMFTVTIIDPNLQPTFGDATIAALSPRLTKRLTRGRCRRPAAGMVRWRIACRLCRLAWRSTPTPGRCEVRRRRRTRPSPPTRSPTPTAMRPRCRSPSPSSTRICNRPLAPRRLSR